MLSASGLAAQVHQFLKFENGVRVRVGSGGNEQQKIPIGRGSKVIAVVGQQLVTKRVIASRDSLSAVVSGSLREMQNADQSRLGQLCVEGALRIRLGLGGNAQAQPDLASHAAVVEQHALPFCIQRVPHRLRDAGIN